MNQSQESAVPSAPQLGLWDAVSIIIGIVVGVSIFKVPFLVFGNVETVWGGFAVWTLGGILSLIGALCYAELATTYPRSGGDYVYLSRAYGTWVGFLFGWAQLAVILTGSIGVMAYAFRDYAVPVLGINEAWGVWLAVGAVVALSIANILGMVWGKVVQNALTIVKVLGLTAIVVVGVSRGGSASWQPTEAMSGPGFGLALIFVLYAFGGWNDAAFVAAEVKNQRRNLPLALLLGTGGITLIYLLVNLAYLWGLGFDGLRKSPAPAAALFGSEGWGPTVISVLVMISALGAVNGLIMTGSRVYATLGADHSLFALLGRWDPRLRSPVNSLVAQCIISVGLILAVGTTMGQNTIDRLLTSIGFAALPWNEYDGGFGTLVAGTAPVFWLFFLLTGLSVFTLREKDHGIKRPFTTPGYPFVPFIFCLTCAYMLYSSIAYAKGLSLLGIVPLLIGVPLYFLSRHTNPMPGHAMPPVSDTTPQEAS
jgi:amino acid transporter